LTEDLDDAIDHGFDYRWADRTGSVCDHPCIGCKETVGSNRAWLIQSTTGKVTRTQWDRVPVDSSLPGDLTGDEVISM
jgi:hypothetical protein